MGLERIDDITILAPYVKNFDKNIINVLQTLDWHIEFISGEDITIDNKIEITLNKINTKYLCIYSQNCKSNKKELEQMLLFLENNDNYWCIGKHGDYFPINDIVQYTEQDVSTCAGRPGIYRVEILKQYWNKAKQDAKTRNNNQSELISHVGYLVKDLYKCKLWV